jgi:hypothetical protein
VLPSLFGEPACRKGSVFYEFSDGATLQLIKPIHEEGRAMSNVTAPRFKHFGFTPRGRRNV